MKHLLLTTIAAVVLVGCGEAQQSTPSSETKPVAEAAKIEPPTAKAPDISIYIATSTGNIEAVKQHLAAGTDVNEEVLGEVVPLHTAARYGHKEIAELLIAKGAEVNAKDDEGETPLDLAWLTRQTETADLLRKHGGKYGTIYTAVGGGDIEAVKEFLAAGVDVNAKDEVGWTPLHIAAIRGNKEIAELLIAEGADVNVKGGGSVTPLHLATTKGIAELLIDKGADVNASSGVETPLHEAALFGHKEIVELLITAGADVNAKKDNGKTPLDLTIRRHHHETADLLRKHGGKTWREPESNAN